MWGLIVVLVVGLFQLFQNPNKNVVLQKTPFSEFLKNIEVRLLINKRSTSWKKLPDKEKTIRTKSELVGLLLKNPTIIKRPIIKSKNIYFIGYDEEKFKLLK